MKCTCRTGQRGRGQKREGAASKSKKNGKEKTGSNKTHRHHRHNPQPVAEQVMHNSEKLLQEKIAEM
jgi:hypothetical protein